MISKKIAILGFGNIATGVLEIIEKNSSLIKEKSNFSLEVKKVLVKDVGKPRRVAIDKGILTTSFDDIIGDPEVDIVIELIGGIDPAYEYIKRSLISGKHVVTANKAVIAKFGEELMSLAEINNVSLRFEASVGGGIPIITSINQSLTSNNIQEIIGILNGTTNYILTRMTKDDLSLDEALVLAKAKGYAEADPSSDIEGDDAVFKLSILAYMAFGVQVPPESISKEGIGKIFKREIEYASQLGYTIKLLAKAKLVGEKLELHIHPSLVTSEHPLAAVSDEFNAIYIRGDCVGQLMFYGKGAGALPTGSAVMADVIDILRNNVSIYNERSTRKVDKIQVIGEGDSEYYIRLQVFDSPGVLGTITTVFGRHNISLASVVQRGKGDNIVPLVFITHIAPREALNNALKEISSIKEVDEIASILRVESL